MDFHRTSKIFILQIVLTTYYLYSCYLQISHLSVAKCSTCFKRLDMCLLVYTTPTLKNEMRHLVNYVQLFQTTVEVNRQLIQHQLALIRLVSMTYFNAKAMPTNDNNYSCCVHTTSHYISMYKSHMPQLVAWYTEISKYCFNVYYSLCFVVVVLWPNGENVLAY